MYGMDGCFDFCRANESLSGIVQGNNIGARDSPVIVGTDTGKFCGFSNTGKFAACCYICKCSLWRFGACRPGVVSVVKVGSGCTSLK